MRINYKKVAEAHAKKRGGNLVKGKYGLYWTNGKDTEAYDNYFDYINYHWNAYNRTHEDKRYHHLRKD